MKIIECIQGSDEWFDVKRGMISASNFFQVLSSGSGRKTYMYRLAYEKITGKTHPTFHNKVMDNGVELEFEAREYYETITDTIVKQVGFVKKDNFVGASPDGLIDRDGLVEIKCPLGTTHIAYIVRGKMPTEYIPQIQGQLWVTERKWCDFVSYAPDVESNPYLCFRIERDEDYIKNLESQVKKFVKQLQEILSKVEQATF